jgi:putative FmdB family regulatory protein
MPIYEYKCPNGHLFEVFHGMTEASPEVCEVCGEGPLKRVLHPVAVHYKGSGFYSTDYGRKGKKPGKEGGSSDSSSSSSSSDGGGSSKEPSSGSSSGGGDSSSSSSGSSGGDAKKSSD